MAKYEFGSVIDHDSPHSGCRRTGRPRRRIRDGRLQHLHPGIRACRVLARGVQESSLDSRCRFAQAECARRAHRVEGAPARLPSVDASLCRVLANHAQPTLIASDNATSRSPGLSEFGARSVRSDVMLERPSVRYKCVHKEPRSESSTRKWQIMPGTNGVLSDTQRRNRTEPERSLDSGEGATTGVP